MQVLGRAQQYADFARRWQRSIRELPRLHALGGTLRQWMIGDALWVAKRAQRKRAFQLRERRACVGELVQSTAARMPGWRNGAALYADPVRR
ncbi:MAG: hypothetical protein U1E63_16490 [Burkholderiales bacterium]